MHLDESEGSASAWRKCYEAEREQVKRLTVEWSDNIGQWQAMRDEVLHNPEWDNDKINDFLGVIDCYMPDTPSGTESPK